MKKKFKFIPNKFKPRKLRPRNSKITGMTFEEIFAINMMERK